MLQVSAASKRLAAPRGIAVLLLAFVLNMALVPCTMAIEVVEDGHDCCPPELRLESSDCCEVDDGSVQARLSIFEFDGKDAPAAAPGFDQLRPAFAVRYLPAVDPPDPPGERPDVNALFCVYLK